ncbi:rCG26492, partial [Rattus norvegicus]
MFLRKFLRHGNESHLQCAAACLEEGDCSSFKHSGVRFFYYC